MALPPAIARPRNIPVLPVSAGNNRISQLSPQPVSNAVIAQQTGAVTDTQQATFTLAAGGTIQVNLSGISFYFAAMTGTAGCAARPINSGQSRSFINYAVGQGLRLGTSGFQKVEVSNLSVTLSVTFTIVVGGGIPNNTYDEFIDKRVIIINNPSSNVFIENGATLSLGLTSRVGAWANSLAPGATQAVTEDTVTYKGRKQIMVSNNDTGQILQVLDANSKIIGTVQPTFTWTHESGGTMIVKNPGGVQTVDCNIGEVYYV